MPSTFRASTEASVTTRVGGESKKTKSYWAEICSISASKAGLSSISAGLGGRVPQGITWSPSTLVGRITSSGVRSPDSTLTIPSESSASNRSAILGRRQSVSITSTLWPARAIVAATLAQSVVLPSLGLAEVTRIRLIGRWAPKNSRLVRIDRSASAAADLLSVPAKICRLVSVAAGRMPSGRIRKKVSSSPASRTVLSKASSRKATRGPKSRASSSVPAAFNITWGWLGELGGVAYWMMLTLEASRLRASWVSMLRRRTSW